MAADERGNAAGAADTPDLVIDLTVFDDERVAVGHGVEQTPGSVWKIDLGGAGPRNRRPDARDDAPPRVPVPATGDGPGVARARARRAGHGRRLAALLVVLLLAAAGALAVIGFRRAAAWREVALTQADRGELLEQRLEEAADVVARVEEAAATAAAERDAALAAREQTAGRLGTSEQDVAALEQRLAVLASDKARLEDELAVAGRSRVVVAEPDESLVRCVQNIGAWLERAPDSDDSRPWSRWAGEATTWRSTCDQATAAVP